MRRARIRRRTGIILAAALVFSGALFAEARIEALAPAIRGSAEIRLEEAFNNRFQISIGSIEGGLIHPVTLKDCTVRERTGPSFVEKFNITGIRSDFMLWDFIRKNRHNKSAVDIDFASKDGTIKGFVKLEGDLSRPFFRGSLEFYENRNIDFSGRVGDDRFEFDLKSRKVNISGSGVVSAGRALKADLKLNHVDICGHDVVCNIYIENRMLEPTDKVAVAIEGQFGTKNLIVDQQPFYEISGSYKVEDDIISILRLSLGDDFRIEGKIFPSEPAAIDVVMTADNANFNRIFDLAGAKNSSSVISGALNGKFAIKGFIDRPKLDARLDIRNGTLLGIDFERLSAVLKGDGAIINIEDSRITRQSGVLVLAGEIDMRKMGKGNAFDDIRLVEGDEALNWDGVDMSEGVGFREVLMKKKVTEDISFGFKKYINSDRVMDGGLRESDEFGFEYKLHPNDSLKVMVGRDKDFFGLEHKDKF